LALLAGIPFDVVITDLGMPGMDGRTVAEEAKRIRPGIPVILMTGWAEELLDAGSPIPGVDRIIGKPLTIEQLATALAEVGGRREG
jgi:CheY-like chemotaxis protein